MVGKERRRKEDKLVPRETWDFCPTMLSHGIFNHCWFEIWNKKNRVVKVFQIFTADYYKSLNFKGICLAQVNPVLNPIQVHFPMKILSPIVSWKIEKVKRTYQSKSIQTKSLSFKIVEKNRCSEKKYKVLEFISWRQTESFLITWTVKGNCTKHLVSPGSSNFGWYLKRSAQTLRNSHPT